MVDKLQTQENDLFNFYLDKVSYNKFRWAYLDKAYSLREIKDMSETLLYS